MADTKRSLSTLLTALFQDGQGGNSMSAQDIRDLIVSFDLPHGGAEMSGNAVATTFGGGAGVLATILGTFVAGASNDDITVNVAGGILTYTGTPDRHFHIVSNFDIIAAGNNKLMKAQWVKNGSTEINPPIKRLISTGADQGAIAIHADVVLSTNDTLQLKITNMTDTTTFTLEDIYTFAMGMMH